jgi:hypothetical protein
MKDETYPPGVGLKQPGNVYVPVHVFLRQEWTGYLPVKPGMWPGK